MNELSKKEAQFEEETGNGRNMMNIQQEIKKKNLQCEA